MKNLFKHLIPFLITVIIVSSALPVWAVTMNNCGSPTMQGCGTISSETQSVQADLIDENFNSAANPPTIPTTWTVVQTGSGATNVTSKKLVSSVTGGSSAGGYMRVNFPSLDREEWWAEFKLIINSDIILTASANGNNRLFLCDAIGGGNEVFTLQDRKSVV